MTDKRINIEKLKKIEEKITKIMECSDIANKSLKDILPRTSYFNIDEHPSYEEPLRFTYCGGDFNSEESELEPFGCDEKKLPEYDMEIEQLIDILSINVINEKGIDKDIQEQQFHKIRELLLETQARALSELYWTVYTARLRKLEDDMSKLEIDGYSYDCWEETNLYFFVDGERYYMMCLDNMLYHAETDKDIENLIKDNANSNHEGDD